jgi:outer membrane receptor protein involved in Fe transport
MLLLALFLAAGPDSLAASPSAASPDSVAAGRKVVREFPALEVRALLPDLESSQTVHATSAATIRNLPVDRLADVLALQPGVVVQNDELHVRGGRAGELGVTLDGLILNEPLRGRFMEVPLFALRSADLVSGTPEVQYTTGLAGALDLRTATPAGQLTSEWKWETDSRTGTHYDRIAGRLDVPLRLFGLGLMAAGDATLDDTSLPALHSNGRTRLGGTSCGWRADNTMLGFVKLAPVQGPERFSAEVLVSRQIHEPYNPSFTEDGWVLVPVNLKETPTFSPVPLPGYQRYRAADHLALTDDRRIAALVKVATPNAARGVSVQLGWLGTQTLTSIGDHKESLTESHRPRYGSPLDNDRFYVLWGDDPLYRASDSDVLTLRCDGRMTTAASAMAAGVGLSNDRVSLLELDGMPFAIRTAEPIVVPLDSIRTYRASAPGGYGYVQGRWKSGGLVTNAGLRVTYFTAGPEARHQTLPGDANGSWSFSPSLGFAYPISARDVFSVAYVRIHQAPGRDYLYDQRTQIGDRQPLGNPNLQPAVMISYEAAVKHQFAPSWAVQTSVFYRDVFGQVGAIDAAIPQGQINLRYANDDEGHALGFEWNLIHAGGERRRVDFHYVYLMAWGNESRPEGDPYGPLRSPRTPSISDRPLSWDRTHTIATDGTWPWRALSISWSTAVMSPLPWTPKPRRMPFTDLGAVNSRRLDWTENTNLRAEWSLPRLRSVVVGLEARNLFDERNERAATLDGYPNPIINTVYDDYGAYRTETGAGGGAYWSSITEQWYPVHDPRLYNPPRAIRASFDVRW